MKMKGDRQLLDSGPLHLERGTDKLGDAAADPRFVLTEPGVGYRLIEKL